MYRVPGGYPTGSPQFAFSRFRRPIPRLPKLAHAAPLRRFRASSERRKSPRNAKDVPLREGDPRERDRRALQVEEAVVLGRSVFPVTENLLRTQMNTSNMNTSFQTDPNSIIMINNEYFSQFSEFPAIF